MSNSSDYILGSSALHERLHVLTGILGKFVASAPRPLNIKQLQEHSGLSPRELTKICASLSQAALLMPVPVPGQGKPSTWKLAGAASALTLEDVMRCVMAEHAARGKPEQPEAGAESELEGLPREVDLLVMQATMGINQCVSQLLRRFTLDRLKFSAASELVAQKTAARAAMFDDALSGQYGPVPCF